MWSTTMTVFFLSSSPFILAEKSNMENVLLEFAFSQKNVEKKQEEEVQLILKKWQILKNDIQSVLILVLSLNMFGIY